MTEPTDLIVLWRAIVQAGGIPAWVDAQLAARNLAVTRRDTKGMSERELEGYKKDLKTEAEERRKLRKQAWLAYKANHVVHLGEGVTVETRVYSRRDEEGADVVQVTLDRSRVRVRWGRAGQEQRLQVLRFNSADEARAAYFDRVAACEAGGYLDATAG